MKSTNTVQDRSVRDFYRALNIFFAVLFLVPILIPTLVFIVIFVLELMKSEFDFELAINQNVDLSPLAQTLADYFILVPLALPLLLPFIAFYVNYTPVKVKNGIVSIPAHDQMRTFTDFLIMNPLTGYFRRRYYNAHEIESVANGYTRPERKNRSRDWNVVISGTKNGRSFSQRIDCYNKQVRDEVRNVLKQVISGKVSSEFSY